MLKLFFSDSLPERRIDIVRAMREREERALAQLRSIEPHASQGPAGAYLTLQMGIGLTEWTIEWCEATERRLAAETEKRVGHAHQARHIHTRQRPPRAARRGDRRGDRRRVRLRGRKALSPYGANDPATQSVQATNRFEAAAGRKIDPGSWRS